MQELNLGGGFGVKYTDEDHPIPYEDYMERVSTAVKAKAKEYGLPVPFILLEPGRSIIATAGITLDVYKRQVLSRAGRQPHAEASDGDSGGRQRVGMRHPGQL